MENIIKDLTDLKKQIDEGKKNLAQLEGRKEELMSSLERDFKVSSLSEAEKSLKKMQEAIEKKEKLIETKYKRLREDFEWE